MSHFWCISHISVSPFGEYNVISILHGRSYHRALGARAPHQRRKLPKLEHVALNSASETGAKMHQNAQICKLNVKNFLGLCPQTPTLCRGYGGPPRPHFNSACLALGLRHLHLPPTRNPGSTPGRTHPLKILATPMYCDAVRGGSRLGRVICMFVINAFY